MKKQGLVPETREKNKTQIHVVGIMLPDAPPLLKGR